MTNEKVKTTLVFWAWAITAQIQYYNNAPGWVLGICYGFLGLNLIVAFIHELK